MRIGEVITSVIENHKMHPEALTVSLPYPNPFNLHTNIRYWLHKRGHVRLSVFDLLGRCVMVLEKPEQPRAEHHVVINASGLSSGVYYVRFQFDTQTITKTVVLMR